MNEGTVVNLFLTLRVLLVGGILLILPRIMRKGLLFGVYIGEAAAKSDAVDQLLRAWRRGCVLVMALALSVGLGISATGWPVTGNLTGTVVLLGAALVLYLRVYARARKLVPADATRQARKAVASLDARRSRGESFARATLAVCLIVSLLSIIYALASYQVMPNLVPTPTGAGTMSEKAIIDFLYFPAFGLAISSLFALLALFSARAKHSLRDGSSSHSAEAQDAFQIFNTRMLSGMALLFCATLTLISVQIIRVGLSKSSSLGIDDWWAAGILLFFMLFFMIFSLFWIIGKYGQGGALREHGSVETRLTGTLADNDRWIWGLFYFDRDDSSMMVEKRFGLGYTLNYGKPASIVFTVTYLFLIIGLATLGVVRVLS